MRIQLCRVFKRYVSPATPVELLKKKSQAADIVAQSGSNFRPIQEVQAAFMLRPKPDEVLCALLWEYKDRGTKGYDLTERFFDLFQARFPTLSIAGPKRSGRDVLLGNIFPDYPKPDRPVDFIIYDTDGQTVLAIGLARYDSDRGGSQEGDRTGGYRDCVAEVRAYAVQRGLTKLKLVFLNDGPGLLLGLMWDRYAGIDESYSGLVRVMTLRMVPERLTYDWLTS